MYNSLFVTFYIDLILIVSVVIITVCCNKEQKPDNKEKELSGKMNDVKLCSYCGQEYHVPKRCVQFIALKNACSRESYVQRRLKVNDIKGYCAAGVLPYYCIGKCFKFLVAEEIRDNVKKYNFIGGKRESKNETP